MIVRGWPDVNLFNSNLLRADLTGATGIPSDSDAYYTETVCPDASAGVLAAFDAGDAPR